jgi:hypothetical protein
MTRPLRWAAAALALAAAAVCVDAFDAGAVPRYSVRYEQNCMLCHVNPTGGGMRSAYATDQLVPKELAMSPKEPEVLAVLDTYLNKHVRIGADFRNQVAQSLVVKHHRVDVERPLEVRAGLLFQAGAVGAGDSRRRPAAGKSARRPGSIRGRPSIPIPPSRRSYCT